MGYPTAATLRALAAEGTQKRAPGTKLATESAGGPDPTPPCCEGGAYGSGYYQITWVDWADIDLTKTRADLQWTWNGSCVDWWYGSGYWWWRTASGWQRTNYDWRMYFQSGCTVMVSDTDGIYMNNSHYFCSNDVGVGVYDAKAYGNQWGEFGGGFWSNSATPCNGGPDIHWHDYLVRTG